MHFFQKFMFIALGLVLASCSVKNTEDKKDVEKKQTEIKKIAADEIKQDYSKAQKNCYLTFDDGPHKNDLKIIEILAQYDAKATFYYNGYRIPGSEHIVRKVVSEGHSLGNHSYSHKNLRTVSPQIQYVEIKKNQDILTRYAPVKTFRPGFGASTNYSHTVLKNLGIKEVLWDVDTFDWRAPSSQYIIDRVDRAKHHPNPVILMHSTANKTVQALPEILDILKQQGCRFESF